MNSERERFWVYILENPKGRFYIGSTDGVDRRIIEHNEQFGHRSFTHKNGLWRLVWREPHASRGQAVTRERQIKSMKSARWIRQNLLNETALAGLA